MAAAAVVSAAIQLESPQRALLEAMAMARPVIVSDLAAGSDTVLAPPAVTEDRMTGWRFRSGDDDALAAALIRLLVRLRKRPAWPSAGAAANGCKRCSRPGRAGARCSRSIPRLPGAAA